MSQPMSISTRSSIVLWLLSGCFLVFAMVVVGGITRLTGSGLSITRWDVVTGTIPPMNEPEWISEFNHYRESPQFKKINAHFELADFKKIYWWEYIHRLLGRLIGLVFVIPFCYFLVKKQLTSSLIYKCLLLFGLGGLQGFIGWYMVSSGLVDIPSVSHFRLALHLVTAFITFGLTFWFAMELINTEKNQRPAKQKIIYNTVLFLFFITIVQIVFGAFVAGMKAGYIYNTWPLMGDEWLPESFFFALSQMGWHALIDNMSGVQVVHRYVAYVLLAVVALLFFMSHKNKSENSSLLNTNQQFALNVVIVTTLLQFVLGVFTLILKVPVLLGVLHQAGAFVLFAAIIYLLHTFHRKAVAE